MNAGATSTRVYEVLREIITRGDLRPGAHLDPAAISGELAASTTPIREALCRLMGEGLVETRQGSGFMLPLLDEPGLKDLYAWTVDLVGLALRRPKGGDRGSALHTEATDDYAGTAARLFAGIAAKSPNREHGQAMERVNAQLHAVRMREPEILADAGEELAAIVLLAQSGSAQELHRLCASYLRKRIRYSAELLRLRYR
jgi:hypothetical protein